MDGYFAPRHSEARAALVCGCMNFGKRTAEAEAERIVKRAIERGVTLFDTANAYGDGTSERIVGRVLRDVRKDVTIATKVGWWKKEGLSRARIAAAVDESLDRLGIETIDLY